MKKIKNEEKTFTFFFDSTIVAAVLLFQRELMLFTLATLTIARYPDTLFRALPYSTNHSWEAWLASRRHSIVPQPLFMN
jgi:hypothetical protein